MFCSRTEVAFHRSPSESDVSIDIVCAGPHDPWRSGSRHSWLPGRLPVVFDRAFCAAQPAGAVTALERIRHSGRLLYGSDMEGGGPYAYPDPRSPRGVTGFEVELMDRLAKDLGVDARVLAGPMGQAASSPRRRSDRPRVQRLRMDRDASPRLPGDAPVLRLSIAVDDAARQLDPVVGRSQRAEAGRRTLDRRRAGRLGRRHVRGRARG